MKMFMESRVLRNPINKSRSSGKASGRKCVLQTTVFCFLVASLLMVSACSDPAKAFTKHFDRANEYIEQEKFEEARIELFNSLKYKPEDVDVLLKLARVQVRLGAFAEAAGTYRVVLKSDPDNRDVAVEYSQLLHAGKGYQEVKRVLSGILEKNPHDPDVLLLLSASLARLGEQKKALSYAEQATGIKPAELNYWLNLVQVRLIGRDFRGAEKDLAKSDSISPGHASVQLARIELRLAQKRLDEAISLFKKLVSDNPENRVYRSRYTMLLETLGHDEEAKDSYEDLLAEEDDAVIRNKLGLLLIRLKDQDGAMENWTRAMEMQESFIDPRLNLARLHLARDENDKALSLAEGILAMDSENPAGLVMRAMVHLKKREYSKSIPDLQKALEANPKNVTGRFLLAQAQLGSGEGQAARISYREVLKEAPDHKQARMALAQLESRLGSLDESSSHARMLSRDPVHGRGALWIMGNNEMRKGNALEAESIYRRAQKEFKKHPGTSIRLAGAIEKQSRPKEALKIYKGLLKDHPDSLIALTAAVRLLVVSGQKDEAVKLTRKHTEDGSSGHRFFLGATYEGVGRTDDAEAAYKDLIDKDPDFTRAYPRLAQLMARQGRLVDAKTWLDKAIKEKPEIPSFYVLKGMVNEVEKDKQSANANYRKALELNPNFLPALNNLAWNLSEEGKLDEAVKLASRAREGAGEDPLIMDTYGWILYKKGELMSAGQELGAAVKAMPNHPDIRDHLAEVLEKLGRETEAKEHRDAAAKLRGE